MQGKPKEIPRTPESAYRFADFELYPSERQLYRQGTPVPLPPKAFDALLLFVLNAGQLVRKEELLNALWPETYVSEANLTNTVVLLRKALGREALQTVSKYGYRLTLPVVGEPGVAQEHYAVFVRAKELTNERSLESMVRARDLYWLCLAEHPEFAPAWAWLGRCCRFIEKFGDDPSVHFELAQAAFRRALSLDPHLACAHQFYTQLQVDCGESRAAMIRLLHRLSSRGEESESFAGLVPVLRFCGLLDESVAAHHRAKELDPTIATSASHSHFLRGEYQATIESYIRGQGYYLDAAAWAALGDTDRAIRLLRERTTGLPLSPLMSGLMGSLLAVLEARDEEAVALMENTKVVREPEVLFYFARHFSLLGRAAPALELLECARSHGLMACRAIERDNAFSAVRQHPNLPRLWKAITTSAQEAQQAFQQAGGRKLFRMAL